MSFVKLFLAALCFPLVAFAAADAPATAPAQSAGEETEFRVINPQINAWAEGTISKIEKDGDFVVRGSQMPFTSVHAQMRQEMQKKLAGVEGAQQRMEIVKKVKADWKDKLDAALNEKRGADKDFTFKQPADSKDVVILDGKSIRELPFFKRLEERQKQREKVGLNEMTFVELYKTHEARAAARAEEPMATSYTQEQRKAAAEKMQAKAKERVEAGREKLEGERMAFSDLKVGDKVFVGFNSDSSTATCIIRKDLSKAEPASK